MGRATQHAPDLFSSYADYSEMLKVGSSSRNDRKPIRLGAVDYVTVKPAALRTVPTGVVVLVTVIAPVVAVAGTLALSWLDERGNHVDGRRVSSDRPKNP